jgi:hypothetical protein
MKLEHMGLRHELKYLISVSDYYAFRHLLKGILKMDENSDGNGNGYHIRSLYFDDIDDSSYHEKSSGVHTRKKYRIRVYNKSDGIIKLERKKKLNQYVNKETYGLTGEDYQKIISRDYDFLLQAHNNVAHDFYRECRSKVMRPKVIVDYVREAYVIDALDVRITFDKELSAGSPNQCIFDEIPTRRILGEGEMILEVKFNDYLPTVIRGFLRTIDKKTLALSKYVMCRQKINL